MTLWLAVAAFALAYVNGANDTFKGVATLFGSRTASYRRALWWATATTAAGCCAAIIVSGGLIKAFSGKGLVPDLLTHDPRFLLAVGAGAAATVLLATRTGWPVSTTHALMGALIGAGLCAAGSVQAHRLGQAFVLPLAVSPLLALVVTAALYPLLRAARLRLGVKRQMCLCIQGGAPQPVRVQAGGTAMLASSGIALTVAELQECRERYTGRLFGFDAQRILDQLHYASAGAVSFARGVNDAPKIAALLLAAGAAGLTAPASLWTVGAAMAAGGLLSARRVALTMSQRITPMNHGQGFTANLVTAFLVLYASRWGLPVSTTHVACGSLFGLGAVTGEGRWRTIRSILVSWLLTLPVAALAAAGCYAALR